MSTPNLQLLCQELSQKDKIRDTSSMHHESFHRTVQEGLQSKDHRLHLEGQNLCISMPNLRSGAKTWLPYTVKWHVVGMHKSSICFCFVFNILCLGKQECGSRYGVPSSEQRHISGGHRLNLEARKSWFVSTVGGLPPEEARSKLGRHLHKLETAGEFGCARME